MTWTKLGDEYTEDCFRLSTDAFRLHTEGLVYSTGKNLDGRLDKARMLRWAYNIEAATELVDCGFWTDEGDHYLIRAHMGWQPTAEQRLAQSMRNRNTRAKGKSRPVRKRHVADEWSDESSDHSSDDRDGSGRDGPGREKTPLREEVLNNGNPRNGNGSGPAHCRYCDAEVPADMASRGCCDRADCQAEAKVEMS